MLAANQNDVMPPVIIKAISQSPSVWLLPPTTTPFTMIGIIMKFFPQHLREKTLDLHSLVLASARVKAGEGYRDVLAKRGLVLQCLTFANGQAVSQLVAVAAPSHALHHGIILKCLPSICTGKLRCFRNAYGQVLAKTLEKETAMCLQSGDLFS